jgi:zinc protease
VAGSFEVESMLNTIRELFEPIPAGTLPQRLVRPEPPASGEHRLVVEGPGETTFMDITYHAPAASHADFFPMTVLDSLLSGPSSLNMFGGGGISNKTSRLYRSLVEKGLAVAVSGGLSATVDPFLYGITITLHPDHTPEEVMAAFEDEIKRIKDSPVAVDEIRRAIKQARALFAYGLENITNQAFWLGHAEMFSTYEWFTSYLEKLAMVSPEEVLAKARNYLDPKNRVIGTYLPRKDEGKS